MKSKKESVNRRGFLKGAAASAAALVAAPVAQPVEAQEAPRTQRPTAVVPNARSGNCCAIAARKGA